MQQRCHHASASALSPRISICPEPVLATHAPSPPAAGSHCLAREGSAPHCGTEISPMQRRWLHRWHWQCGDLCSMGFTLSWCPIMLAYVTCFSRRHRHRVSCYCVDCCLISTSRRSSSSQALIMQCPIFWVVHGMLIRQMLACMCCHTHCLRTPRRWRHWEGKIIPSLNSCLCVMTTLQYFMTADLSACPLLFQRHTKHLRVHHSGWSRPWGDASND